MPRKLRSSFVRSLLLHGALILVIAVLVYHPHEDEPKDTPIVIDSIQLGKEVKKVFHSVVHSIGLPHSEPEPEDNPAEKPDAQPPPRGPVGDSGGDSSPGDASEMQKYLAAVVARIDRQKHYPKAARFQEQEGLVRILLEVSAEGRVLRSEVEAECVFPLLNQAALEAVRAVGTLPPLPASQSGKSVVLHVPIRFQIER
jgi:TonB family protein